MTTDRPLDLHLNCPPTKIEAVPNLSQSIGFVHPGGRGFPFRSQMGNKEILAPLLPKAPFDRQYSTMSKAPSSSPENPDPSAGIELENTVSQNGETRKIPRNGHPMFSCTGNLFLVFGTVALGFFASLLGWLPPRGSWMHWLAKAWGRGLLIASGCQLEIERSSRLYPATSYVFMANHQSLYDVAALLVSLPDNSLFLAKKSLFKIPFFGWSLSAGGFVPVDREDRSSALETFRLSLERLRAGRSLVIFPEETRSLDGHLLPFKPGGFLLALKTGRPIVPIGLSGTLEIRRKGTLGIRPHRIKVTIGRPIDPAEFGVARRRELIAEVRERISALRSTGDNPR